MPELPEVETIARQLRPDVVGRTITRVDVYWRRSIATGVEQFHADALGRRIVALTRRAKYLIFTLDSGDALLVHLRMTGRMAVEAVPDIPDTAGDAAAGDAKATRGRFTRIALALDDGHMLNFDDARKFGKLYLVPDPMLITGPLGPEPLELDLRRFRALWGQRARRLKPLLLDQTFLAGLGNIYTDESLHHARLHPLRRSDSLSADEVARLYHAIRQTLTRAINAHGSSIDWAYEGGTYQERLRVYGRAGEACRVCGTRITRSVVGQRGTYTCAVCQPLSEEGLHGTGD